MTVIWFAEGGKHLKTFKHCFKKGKKEVLDVGLAFWEGFAVFFEWSHGKVRTNQKKSTNAKVEFGAFALKFTTESIFFIKMQKKVKIISFPHRATSVRS